MITMPGPGPVVVRKTVLNRLHPAVVLAGFMVAGLCVLLGGGVPALALALLTLAGLGTAGWKPVHVGRLLRPWLPLAVLVVIIHTLTTTSAAPLGHPSWAGCGLGIVALVRLAGLLMGLVLLQGTLDIEDLVAGMTWWLRPVQGRFIPAHDVGLILAVALGTAPRVLSEGQRMQGVIRLRRGRAQEGWRKWSPWRLFDKVSVVIPLLEGLARRAETVSLALRLRRPGEHHVQRAVDPLQWVLLWGWVILMVGLWWLSRRLW